MSNDTAKFINSRRRHKTDVAIARQVRIAKSHNSFNQKNIKEKHRLAKHHAMDCGTPGCILCANPRHNKMPKTKDQLTIQERKFFQDTDNRPKKHGNGTVEEDN